MEVYATQNIMADHKINEEDSELLDIGQKDFDPISRKSALKNFLTLSLCYFLLYTGLWGLHYLQSTMNADSGIGVDSQAIFYAFAMTSALILPQLAIAKCGCKNVLIIGMTVCCLYIASNVYLRFDTMMVSATLYGLGTGPFIASQSLYVNEMGKRFHSAVGGKIENVMAYFFGLYAISRSGSQGMGNFISYLVLRAGKGVSPTQNTSEQFSCGIHFQYNGSGSVSNSILDPPSEHDRMILIGIFTLLGVIALLVVIFFLDPLPKDFKKDSGCYVAGRQLLAALKHLGKPNQILLIPITVLIGLEMSFYSTEFTAAYIACSWGVHHVGFVTVCFGVCGALMSLLVGPLVKCVSQMAVLILAACANVSMCIVLFLWEPSPDFTPAYFIIAGVWGMGDAIWWSQVTALYGLMFPNDREAAFSNLYFWSFLGFFLSYSYANYFTVAVKINILLCFLVTGMIGYLIGQIKIKCTTTREYVSIPNGEEE